MSSNPRPHVRRLDLTTGEMLRAGRAIARIEQGDLAVAAGVSLETVKRLERIRGPVNASRRTLQALNRAFEDYGVQFFNDGEGRQCVCLGVPGGDPHWVEMDEEPSEPTVVWLALYQSAATPETISGLPVVLDAILRTSIANNARLGLTGALLSANGRFLQALEGPRAEVLQVMGRIAMDPRHQEFTPLKSDAVDGRRFGDWLMAARTSPDRADSAEAPNNLFVPERLSPESALDLLLQASAQERAALD